MDVSRKESVLWYLEARRVAIPLWKIALDTGVSESSVYRALRDLIAEKKVARLVSGNNRGRSLRRVYYALRR